MTEGVMTRRGHPPKVSDKVRRALVKKTTKQPRVTLKEIERSTAQIGEGIHMATRGFAKKAC